ncbi:Vacuolar protein sorting-associated protein 53 [Physocladia obscura]|uniref:Vacuolar protein sorting-associated protein 53 n=1 Tax=Physocladia obscura TaxID=109957 RepID=A0AAD5T9F3_9FUNG|nr:Vacuolar protein sorting-associated protein 53 [Physocladia obscura]
MYLTYRPEQNLQPEQRQYSDVDMTLSKLNSDETITHTDPLDSPDFDPLHYISIIFPNKSSSAESVLTRVRSKLVAMDHDISHLVRVQADKAVDTKTEFEESKESICLLFEKIRRIREKASASEQLVHDITREITSLDQAKKNLMVSMATVKKLQMLAASLDHMKLIVARKQYLDVAQLFEIYVYPKVIIKLSNYFESFRNVAQIAVLLERVVQMRIDLKRQIFVDFDEGFVSGTLRFTTSQLSDACFAIQVLGTDVHLLRAELTNWYCDIQLKDYKAIFRQNLEVGSLDAVSRRYAWLKRLLKTHDEEHAPVFPPHWKVAENLCERFCADTKKDISDVLIKTEATIDVKIMLMAIQQTVEFESKVAGRFTPKNLDDDAPYEPSKFKAIISCCFEPYLRLYINYEEKNLAEMFEKYKVSSEAEDEEAVFVSSTDLFLFYRQTLVQCSKLSTNKPFLELCRMFAKWLKNYADILVTKLPSEDDLKIACIVINTADYCSQTASQLEEKLIEKIDEKYKSSVSFSQETEAFINVTGLAVKSLANMVEIFADSAITVMLRRPWGTIDLVGDQSEYISMIGASVTNSIAFIRRYLTTQKYLRTFFDKFSESFLNKFHASIFRCKPISEVGAEQLLLDTHALKTILIQMTNTPASVGIQHSDLSPATSGSPDKVPPPAAFLKILGKGVLKVEQLLKVVLRSVDPPAGIVETYILLFPDGDSTGFQKILDLKGLKRAEQQPILECYQQRVGVSADASIGNKTNIASKFKFGKMWGRVGET